MITVYIYTSRCLVGNCIGTIDERNCWHTERQCSRRRTSARRIDLARLTTRRHQNKSVFVYLNGSIKTLFVLRAAVFPTFGYGILLMEQPAAHDLVSSMRDTLKERRGLHRSELIRDLWRVVGRYSSIAKLGSYVFFVLLEFKRAKSWRLGIIVVMEIKTVDYKENCLYPRAWYLYSYNWN